MAWNLLPIIEPFPPLDQCLVSTLSGLDVSIAQVACIIRLGFSSNLLGR
jgi:hypothetical protein